LTNEDIIKLQKHEFLNPYEGTQNILSDKKDIIKLEEHQQKFLNGFLIGNLRGAIVYHGVGTGKTFTAVATAKMYLQLYPNNKVFVITPSAVLYNFIDSMLVFGIDPRDTRYNYYTYDKFSRDKNVKVENALLIVDEAHNFRTEMTIKETDDKQIYTDKNKRGLQLLLKGGIPCHKCLMLTATPFVNIPYDIENLLAFSDGRYPIDKEAFGTIASSNNMRYDYFKYRISKYEKDINNKYFPKKKEIYVPLVVENNDSKISALMNRITNPVYTGSRQNSLDIKKFDYVMNKILNNNNKYVIYTAFQDYGVVKLEKMMEKNNISFGIISGKQSSIQKSKYIDGYNEYDSKEEYNLPKYRILIITKAGAEGVNLKRTKGIFILDGVWNDALYEQIVARAIRFKSHYDLPVKEQTVDVYKLFLCYDWEEKILDKLNNNQNVNFLSILNNILEDREKQKKLNKFKNDKLSKKAENDFNIEIMKKYTDNKDFDPEYLKTLKKGSKERHEYLENNKQFAKNKEQYIAQETRNLVKGTPTIDFYMFILQKVKTYVIDKFIKSLSDIPKVENSINDIPEVKKLFNEIINNKLTGSQMMNKIFNFLKSDISDIEKYIDKVDNIKMKKYLEERNIEKENIKNKLLVKAKQEYFTPPHVIDELFKFANIEKTLKSVRNDTYFNVLEPSAGHGAIVGGIMKFFDKQKAKYKIDMVEYSDDNRKILEEIEIKDFIELKKTKNFLEFYPNQKYDFIFMNPPFHLDKRFNKEYINDIYDYDFIKRAYACLAKDGVLIAITGLKWKENNEIVKWYKQINALIEDKNFTWKGKGLKKGAEINNLKVSFIKIVRPYDDHLDDKEILDKKYIKISLEQKEKILEINENFQELSKLENNNTNDYIY